MADKKASSAEGFFTSYTGLSPSHSKEDTSLLRSFLNTAKPVKPVQDHSNRNEDTSPPPPLLSPRPLIPSANDVDAIVNSVHVRLSCRNVPNRSYKTKRKLHPFPWDNDTKILPPQRSPSISFDSTRKRRNRKPKKSRPKCAASVEGKGKNFGQVATVEGSGYDLEATRIALERTACIERLKEVLNPDGRQFRRDLRRIEKTARGLLQRIRELGVALIRRLVRVRKANGGYRREASKCKVVHRFTHMHDHSLLDFEAVDGDNYLVQMERDLDFLESSLDLLKQLNLVNVHIKTVKRNPFLLILTLEDLFQNAVVNVDCPEGCLWKLLIKPAFQQELFGLPASCQDVYYAALVVARECDSWRTLHNVDKDAEEISDEAKEQLLLQECLERTKHSYSDAGSWLAVKRKQDESILPLAPYVKVKARKLFEEERVNLEVAARERGISFSSKILAGLIPREQRQKQNVTEKLRLLFKSFFVDSCASAISKNLLQRLSYNVLSEVTLQRLKPQSSS